MSNQAEIVPSIALLDGSSPSGCMLIERVLQQIFQTAFANLKADPSTVDDLFYKLAAPERTSIKNWLTALNLTVRTAYPETGFTQPMICIINESDDEQAQQDFLGDQMGLEGEDVTGTPAYYTLGHMERSAFNLMLFAGKDSNAVLWLYYLVKAILLLNLPLLESHGVIAPTVSGRDLSFREDMFPEFVYSRVVTMTCQQVFSLYVNQAVGRTLVVQTLPQPNVKVKFTVP